MISKSNRLIIVFFTIQSGLFLAIHFLDLPLRSGILHYASIVLCALLVFLVRGSDKELQWTRVAFFFTLAADWFLTYLQTEQWLGTVLFLFSQLAYAKRLLAEERRPNAGVLLRIGMIAALLTIGLTVVGRLDWLMAAALICYGLHLANALDATFRWHSNRWFAIGLWLYVICDALVGLSQSEGYLSIAPGSILDWFVHGPVDWIWMFYLPSQTLIVASAIHPALFDKKRMAV